MHVASARLQNQAERKDPPTAGRRLVLSRDCVNTLLLIADFPAVLDLGEVLKTITNLASHIPRYRRSSYAVHLKNSSTRSNLLLAFFRRLFMHLDLKIFWLRSYLCSLARMATKLPIFQKDSIPRLAFLRLSALEISWPPCVNWPLSARRSALQVPPLRRRIKIVFWLLSCFFIKSRQIEASCRASTHLGRRTRQSMIKLFRALSKL